MYVKQGGTQKWLKVRRFAYKRGQVTHMCSDNGTNLIGTKKEPQRINGNLSTNHWNQSKIQFQKGVQWSFNPPAASHHGGVWVIIYQSADEHTEQDSKKKLTSFHGQLVNVLFRAVRIITNLWDEGMETVF